MNDVTISRTRTRSRREFLTSAGKSLGLAALSYAAVGALLKDVRAASKTVEHLSPEASAFDENFWFTIQQAFTVTRGTANFTNGGVSPSPVIVTRALISY